MWVTDNEQNTLQLSCDVLLFLGHFCTDQKVIINSTSLKANSYVQKVWQTTSLQKFYVDPFLIKATFSIFSSIYIIFCTYISDKIEAEIH